MKNKKARVEITTVIVMIVIIVGGVFVALNYPKGNAKSNFMEVQFYDVNGKMIGSTDNIGFAVVNNVPGVTTMRIIVNVKNTGDLPLSVNIPSAVPAQFDAAMPKNSQAVQPGATVSWTSSDISVEQFVTMSQPVTFTATARGSYVLGGTTTFLPDKTGMTAITFAKDATGNFDVTINPSVGSSGAVCGNGLCEGGETATSCAADCSIAKTCTTATSGITECIDTGHYHRCLTNGQWSGILTCSSGTSCTGGSCK